MAFSFVGNATGTATGATEIDCNRPAGVAVGNLIVVVFAFEGVASGSGPWIIPNNGQFISNYIGAGEGWQQVCWQTPSATGVGIEVWAAIHQSGAVNDAKLIGSMNAVAVAAAWSGEYNPTGTISGAPPRLAVTAQVTGNQPAAPSVVADLGELIIACGGDLMGGGGFGIPSGFTSRVDAARAGAGTVEATLADITAVAAGSVGPITFPNAAASTTTRGATATLAIRPTPTVAGAGPVLTAGMPEGLDLSQGCTVTFTAIDPTTGNLVSGVTVTNSSIWADDVQASGQALEAGPFMLVPGPGA